MKEEDMETEGAKPAAASVSDAPPASVVSAQESETGECAPTRTMTENEEKVKTEPDPTPLSVGESSSELLEKTEPCEETVLTGAEKYKVTELETKREGRPAAKQEPVIKQRTVVANQSPTRKTSGKGTCTGSLTVETWGLPQGFSILFTGVGGSIAKCPVMELGSVSSGLLLKAIYLEDFFFCLFFIQYW